ncbi:DUF6603 domain-containing protein [Streptomyces purpureus]|uniref:DUF6603 domain-containing protein n=1 Tax=Streptomyces purpureus TaxID=1951 RepID=UPI000366A353|nr:DUF6603 domain-containing protein [Streptomyces purpureus]
MASVVGLATQLRSGLSGTLPSLGGISQGPERWAALGTALGLPSGTDMTAATLLARLAGVDDGQAGELWPRLVELLRGATDRAGTSWSLEVPGAVSAAGGQVHVLGPTLPTPFTVKLLLDTEVHLAQGLRLPGGSSLSLTVPADPADAALKLDLRSLRLALGAGDGLLSLLVPGGVVLEGDVPARVDAKGVHFEGGSRNALALPLKSAPPGLRAPSLYLAPRDGGLSFTASFGASLLGLADATVDGVGTVVGPGAATSVVGPTGIGLSLALGPARGSGFLDGKDGEYRGALALSLGLVEVRAFAILRTRQESLLVALSAEFTPPIELGLALTLNAVGGILGVNHAIDQYGLASAVRSGHLDHVLFPEDPATAAPQILSTLASVFRTERGSRVVGPMLRLGWGRPVSFVTADIGLILEPTSGTTALLGRLRVALPAPQAPIIDLRASVEGLVEPDGTVRLSADLSGSRLLTSSIEGGMALRISPGAGPGFLFSAGGWHPEFPAPAGFPPPRRLSLALSDTPLLRIVFSGYLALTPGTVQAGADLAVVIGSRSTGVTGHLHFDALVRWEPSFGVVLDLRGGFALRFGGRTICSVQLRVRVEGPTPCWHIAGRATVSLFFIDIDFPFDEHWACTKQVTADPPPDIALRLEQELGDARNWAPLVPQGTGPLVSLRAGGKDAGRLLHPLGRLRFTQRVVPLGVLVSRFGAARLPTPTAFDVTVGFTGGTGTSTDVTEHFARADFFELTDAEKLSQPSFERLRSGSELTPPPDAPSATRYTADLRYESKWLGAPDEDPQLPRWAASEAYLNHTVAHGAVAMGGAHTARTRYVTKATCPSGLRERAFRIVDADTLTAKAEFPHEVPFTKAAEALLSAPGRARLHVVPVHEVRP